ncbi:mitochondrial ribosomal subunit protein-domain-containing protein [Talaromyces proteolyticus]|uniref:Mitochondrial ribosomal subunit protein-domain-containing protein n=1 Tax=Talaromyces proteolyticus TaxID=1131652 RepID=A0AAD4KVD7_9EURO|nr:mitochondrial ribosomal subunit protein-domain-containing protein [Talaromyces proteolyticus]KAH8701922.1 mitochondrial ribosomal subunit protein-domain-containing protein [Talaromyces proteolyticus]
MAGTTRALSRAALALSRRPAASRSQLVKTQPSPIALQQTRFFSPSPFSHLPKDRKPTADNATKDLPPEDIGELPSYSVDNFTKAEKTMYELMSPEERALFDAENKRFVEMWNDPEQRKEDLKMVDEGVRAVEKDPLRFEEQKTQRGFWANEEDDEFSLVEDGDDVFHDDEITSMAHAELELHREVREYARIAAWDMPLLSKLAKPFELPKENQILRFRYTTYLGEQHPAEHKVVVELSSKDLVPKHLSEAQRQTFLKLVGTRYNPDTDIVHMSCEKFSARAQNKRYLGDTIKSLIKEAKEGDSFADVPLDLRHHKPKTRITFPESWKMTEARQQQLAADRQSRLGAERERNNIIDGKEAVLYAIRTLPSLSQIPHLKGTDDKATLKETVSRGKGVPRNRRVV